MTIARNGACAVMIALGACVVPGEPESEPGGVSEDIALYRVGEGECLSGIAERLSYPGGWRALAKANHLRGELIREGAALRVPIAYITGAGLDPVRDFGLEPFREPIAKAPLVACRDEVARGACATVGDTRLCVEETEASPLADPNSDDDCLFEADGAIDCASQPGRVLVAYRGGERREIASLPQRGGLDVEAHRVDLDADGRAEIVAAIPIELHNHEVWESVRAVVLDDRGELAASFDDAQWGDGSILEGEQGCDLLATSWEWVRHPLEGEGMYFVGRRLAWRDGQLVPRAGEAMRRFRTYFHVDAPQTPAAWLSGAETSWWPELGDGTPVRREERGVIVDAWMDDGAVVTEVEFGGPGGRRVRFDPNASEYDDARPRDVLPVSRLRAGERGATLPDMFAPADPRRWIGDAAIAIETGDDDGGAPIRELWLAAPMRASQR